MKQMNTIMIIVSIVVFLAVVILGIVAKSKQAGGFGEWIRSIFHKKEDSIDDLLNDDNKKDSDDDDDISNLLHQTKEKLG